MAKAKKKPHQFGGYRLYQFGTDQDPVIDVIRTGMEKHGITLQGLANDSDVSEGTLRNWMSGKVRRPQHATIKAAVRALGPSYDYEVTRNGRSVAKEWGLKEGATRRPAKRGKANA